PLAVDGLAERRWSRTAGRRRRAPLVPLRRAERARLVVHGTDRVRRDRAPGRRQRHADLSFEHLRRRCRRLRPPATDSHHEARRRSDAAVQLPGMVTEREAVAVRTFELRPAPEGTGDPGERTGGAKRPPSDLGAEWTRAC